MSNSYVTVCQITSALWNFRLGGTAGAVVTCPLEVLKTRLQSSTSGFNGEISNESKSHGSGSKFIVSQSRNGFISSRYAQTPRTLLNVMSHSTASSSQSPHCGCPSQSSSVRISGHFGSYAVQAKSKIFTDAAAVSRTPTKSMMQCFRYVFIR